ncbi:hypothetical protein LEMLEM_LOCUS13331 [Lemmus lemmus]
MTEDDFKLLILLPLPSKCWDCRHASPQCWGCRTSCMPGKYDRPSSIPSHDVFLMEYCNPSTCPCAFLLT